MGFLHLYCPNLSTCELMESRRSQQHSLLLPDILSQTGCMKNTALNPPFFLSFFNRTECTLPPVLPTPRPFHFHFHYPLTLLLILKLQFKLFIFTFRHGNLSIKSIQTITSLTELSLNLKLAEGLVDECPFPKNNNSPNQQVVLLPTD